MPDGPSRVTVPSVFRLSREFRLKQAVKRHAVPGRSARQQSLHPRKSHEAIAEARLELVERLSRDRGPLDSAITTPMRLRVRCCSSSTMIRIRASLSLSASSARRRSPISTKVTTTPSILSSTVRYGLSRVRYQPPSLPCTSRSLGVRSRRTLRASPARSVVVEAMGEIGDRAAFVASHDVEEFRDARREPIDPQFRIEEQDSDICRGHQILHVAMGARDGSRACFSIRC